MAKSGIPWIDTTFNWSVWALIKCAKFLGITYEEINVWLFCVAWPVMTLVMMLAIWRLWKSNRALAKLVRSGNKEST